MLRSRMFTPAFRFFAGLAVLLARRRASSSAFSSEVQSPMDRILGPLTMGWKGGIGNHFAYTFFAGLVAAVGRSGRHPHRLPRRRPRGRGPGRPHRDRAPHPGAGGQQLPPRPRRLRLRARPRGPGQRQPHRSSAAARGRRRRRVRLDPAGLGRAGHRRRHDQRRALPPLRRPAAHAGRRHRLHRPLVVLGLSRVLLAVSKTGSVIVFGVVAALFFIVAALLALVPEVHPDHHDRDRRRRCPGHPGRRHHRRLRRATRDIEHHERRAAAEATTGEAADRAVTIVLPAALGVA